MKLKHSEIISTLTLFERASLLKGQNVWETRSVKGLPSAFLADGPHGLRKQAGSADILGLNPSLPATCFPTASALANSWDESLLEEVGTALGVEAAALDVSVVLGPGLNIKRSPLCGRNFEYFSEDPLLAGKLAACLIRGIQSTGVAACPKHFAVNSQELLRMSSDSIVDERTLREIYLTGFEIVVKEGYPKALMSSYNLINGQYAHENKKLLDDILRSEWGFDGAVISDWGGVNDVVASAKNGGTLEMPGGGFDSARQLVKAVKDGELSEEILNKRVDEVIELVLGTTKKIKKTVDFDKHHALAYRAAAHSAVLLKNDGILPLKKGIKVAVIGRFAQSARFQGAGSSQVNAVKADNAMSAAKAAGFNLQGFAAGYCFGINTNQREVAELTQEAILLAEHSDVVLFYLGLDEASESEGLDRTHINLPQNQLTLLDEISKTGKPIVAVIAAGSVVDMSWTYKTQAVVHGFLHGQAGAAALIDIITGKVNPSGRLAETYPVKLADTPVHRNYPSEARTAEYREGLYVGYRYSETVGIPAAYPFGFGLSYTKFEYTDLTITKNGASFTIINIGDIDGDEVAQFYVSRIGGNVFRPIKELKGFKRVKIKAGANERVTIPFNEYTFRYFRSKTGRWEVEGGDYEILIGASVADIRLNGTITILGTIEETYDKSVLSPYFNGNICSVNDQTFTSLLGHEVPSQDWLESGLFQPNNALRQAGRCKSRLLRLVSRIVHKRTQKIGKDGRPDLNMVFIYNMPFRAFARNAGHLFTLEMVEGVVAIANGHFFKGLGRVIGGFFRNKKANKQGEIKLYGKGRK